MIRVGGCSPVSGGDDARTLLGNHASQVESHGPPSVPLDGGHDVRKRRESLLDDVERVRVEEPRGLAGDGRAPVVDLQVDGAQLLVRAVPVPADEQPAVRLDPVTPVVLVRVTVRSRNPTSTRAVVAG